MGNESPNESNNLRAQEYYTNLADNALMRIISGDVRDLEAIETFDSYVRNSGNAAMYIDNQPEKDLQMDLYNSMRHFDPDDRRKAEYCRQMYQVRLHEAKQAKSTGEIERAEQLQIESDSWKDLMRQFNLTRLYGRDEYMTKRENDISIEELEKNRDTLIRDFQRFIRETYGTNDQGYIYEIVSAQPDDSLIVRTDSIHKGLQFTWKLKRNYPPERIEKTKQESIRLHVPPIPTPEYEDDSSRMRFEKRKRNMDILITYLDSYPFNLEIHKDYYIFPRGIAEFDVRPITIPITGSNYSGIYGIWIVENGKPRRKEKRVYAIDYSVIRTIESDSDEKRALRTQRHLDSLRNYFANNPLIGLINTQDKTEYALAIIDDTHPTYTDIRVEPANPLYNRIRGDWRVEDNGKPRKIP